MVISTLSNWGESRVQATPLPLVELVHVPLKGIDGRRLGVLVACDRGGCDAETQHGHAHHAGETLRARRLTNSLADSMRIEPTPTWLLRRCNRGTVRPDQPGGCRHSRGSGRVAAFAAPARVIHGRGAARGVPRDGAAPHAVLESVSVRHREDQTLSLHETIPAHGLGGRAALTTDRVEVHLGMLATPARPCSTGPSPNAARRGVKGAGLRAPATLPGSRRAP